MKNSIFVFSIALLTFSLNSCIKDTCENVYTYQRFDPVFVNPDILRQKIVASSAKELVTTGKIYVYGDYLLINEPDLGIHIVDNKIPTKPIFISFVKIPGNSDLAVRNNLLYADSYIDLVVLDLKNPQNVREVFRVENAFPSYGKDEKLGLLVAYKPAGVTESFPCSENTGNTFFEGNVIWTRDNNSLTSGLKTPSGTVGIGGSTARFTMNQGLLYTVSTSNLSSFKLEDNGVTKQVSTQNVGWNIETIYPFEGLLFIGSQTGMYIYGLDNPEKPSLLSTFEHWRACDPVVSDGKTAFVTLRDGTECEGFLNQLDVINVSDVKNPKLIKSYPLHHPIGLSVNKGLLFICEDDKGIKLFDTKDLNALDKNLIYQDKSFSAVDIIVLEEANIAIITGEEGVWQFSFKNPAKWELLSNIKTKTDD
jgi:hypothetical protein